jgi:hypothetical protein
VVGTEMGCGLVRDGFAQAVPHRFVALDALSAQVAAELARLSALPEAAHG